MNVITHSLLIEDPEKEFEKIKNRIIEEGDQPDSTLKERLQIFEKLLEFEYGRWLLLNRGLNGYWAEYMITKDKKNIKNELEYLMLEKSPGVLASKEIFEILQQNLKKYLKDNLKLAAIPCGFMRLLYSLDYTNTPNVKLVGIDIDPMTIQTAAKRASSLKINNKVEFICEDAWKLDIHNEYDIIINHGLNMFVFEESKLIQLYEICYKALKPNGYLFLTAYISPRDENNQPVWDMSTFDPEDLRLQKVIYNDIIKVRQGLFRTPSQIDAQLKTLKFNVIDVIHDSRKMFTLIIARK